MSFFKDFKDDISQAVDELMPGDASEQAKVKSDDDMMVDTLSNDPKAQSELSNLDALLEKVSSEETTYAERRVATATTREESKMSEENVMPVQNAQPVQQEERRVAPVMRDRTISEETTIITNGTVIHGNIESTGSLDISGTVDGDVICNGKLTVTGAISGNSNAEEIFADAARIDGEITSNGTVKIGLGSVVIGNVTANSAVIAGAIKGDIDIHGPVVVDTSAVVVGNIKSRSVQINNGAVIDGFCSQVYADVDVESLFGKKGN